MRTILSLIAVATFSATVATAQAQTPTKPMTAAPSATAPLPGANSFTQGEAKSRIEKAGYTNVSGLTKDNEGIWRGTASKGGQSVKISLDYKGNVTEN